MDSESEERIMVFLESMAPRNTVYLNRLEQEALESAVPVIRAQTQSLIQFLMRQAQPRRILEVGTATGFSACLMLTYAPENVQITTIEKDPERYREACRNFAAIDADPSLVPGRHSQQIRAIQGDAAEVLKELAGSFDFIFMDAAKGQYINFLPDILQLLAPRGLLLSDNIFMGGEILQSRYAVKRRDRTIHKRMREYLDALTRNPELQTLVLQEGDGAALTLKL